MSVYFARVRGYVKIGYSANPFRRIQNITGDLCKKPADIQQDDHVDLFGWYPGDRAAEYVAQASLLKHHVVGEWYWDDPEVEEYFLAQDGVVDLDSLSIGAVRRIIHDGVSVTEAVLLDAEWRAGLQWSPLVWDGDGQRAIRERERQAYRAAREAVA
jgi:hypothetical protein